MEDFNLLEALHKQNEESGNIIDLINELELARNNCKILFARGHYVTALNESMKYLNLLNTFGSSDLIIQAKIDFLMDVGSMKRDLGLINGLNGAIFIYQNAIHYSRKIGDLKKIATALFNLGACFEMSNLNKLSCRYYLSALDQINGIKNTEYLKSNIITRLGCILTKSGYLDQAMIRFTEAMRLREENIVFNDTTFIEMKMGILYLSQNRLDEAYRLAEKVEKKSLLKSNLFEVQSLIFSSNVLFEAGEVNFGLDKLIEAEQKSITNSFSHQLISINNLTDKYVKMDKKYKLANILWNYHVLNQKIVNSDVIMVLGNSDISTIKRGVELFHKGIAPYILITGGNGSITSDKWEETEAQKFFRIALELGVEPQNIILEDKSSNTGENYLFSKKVLLEKGISFKNTIIVTKPYMERRAYATAKVHWNDINISITSIQLSFSDYLDIIGDDNFVINLMVGDLQRIIIYPQDGYQIHQDVPKTVHDAYLELIQLGFTKRLIVDSFGKYR